MEIHFINNLPENKWPDIWKECLQSWCNTSYTINFWNKEGIEKLLKEDDNDFYENYLTKIPSIYSIDYVKYIILEKYGGMYVDMDIKLIKDFIPMLNPDKIYMIEGGQGEIYNNCLIIAPKITHTVWERIKHFTKQKIISSIEDCKNVENTIYKVGAVALSEWFVKHFNKTEHLHKVGILSSHHFEDIDSDICFTKHYYTHQWNYKNNF